MTVRLQSLIIATLLSMFLWIAIINCGVWLSWRLAGGLTSISTGKVIEAGASTPV